MSLQKSFSRNPFLFSQKEIKATEKPHRAWTARLISHPSFHVFGQVMSPGKRNPCTTSAKLGLNNYNYYNRGAHAISVQTSLVPRRKQIPNTAVSTQGKQSIPNTPVLKHRLIPNSKNHIKQTLNVRCFSVTAGRWPFSRIQTTISQEPH